LSRKGSDGTARRSAKNAKSKHSKNCKGQDAYQIQILFTGYDPEKHADFDLVPRLIGRKGCNMVPIFSTGAKARVRGAGSGHFDSTSPNGEPAEADLQLQLVISSPTKEVQDAALRSAEVLLEDISFHFGRYCGKKRLPCPTLYSIA